MLGAVFLFTVMDAIAKQLTKEVGLIQTIWVRYTGQALLVFLIVLPRLREVAKSQYPKLQLLRSVIFNGCHLLILFKHFKDWVGRSYRYYGH
tara:strand:- start:815 stop:1090 length:276 start_codon:yes stop_codon:yes gene_type:complete